VFFTVALFLRAYLHFCVANKPIIRLPNPENNDEKNLMTKKKTKIKIDHGHRNMKLFANNKKI
jgi:hypothetical protein